ncbi:MAG: hypothetical protein HC800_09540 [Phormidesmis sp. RL_2_1]|nr:hypothetical protein [Phormidesmis sp. RL_2_1]
MPPIFFYIPPALWPAEDLPTYADQNWAGYGLGIYAWTVQTYLKLRSAGLTCELTYQLPAEGIVFCHSNALRAAALSTTAAAAPRRLLVCMKAESPLSAIAPVHIVQNPIEASPSANCYYIPHWPQPQLIARDRARAIALNPLLFLAMKII